MARGSTQNYYSFQILSEEQVRHSTLFGQPSNPMSLNYRLGNMDTTAKNTELTWTSFHCTPQLTRDGEAIYISSNSLSAHTGVLPAGMKSAICRIPVAEYGENMDYQMQSLSQGYTEVGGLSLKRLHFSVRDYAGNLVPLGNGNWSCQLVFGFPGT